MKKVFTATAKKLPEGLQVETSAREFKFIMDEPADLGGTNQGMNPVEALLCSLGACQAIVVGAFAKSKNFTYDEFHIELEGYLDTDGFSGINPNVRKGFAEIRFEMHFKTKESKEKVKEFADFVEKTCPVCDCLENKIKLVRTGIVID